MSQLSVCQICTETHSVQQRYPNAVCNNCIYRRNNTLYDSDGNVVTFSNIDEFGGFVSIHRVNNIDVKRSDHVCYINGKKCYADEARFGGIVIQCLPEVQAG